MQYETAEENGVLEESRGDRLAGILKSALKRLVVFICFGPGVLGVLWFLGRLLKR